MNCIRAWIIRRIFGPAPTKPPDSDGQTRQDHPDRRKATDDQLRIGDRVTVHIGPYTYCAGFNGEGFIQRVNQSGHYMVATRFGMINCSRDELAEVAFDELPKVNLFRKDTE